MPTSLYIVGLDPPGEFRPSQAPWAAGTARRINAARLGFNDHLFVQGHCHHLYDSQAIRRRDVSLELGHKAAQVMLSAARHEPAIFVLFGETVSEIFLKELGIPPSDEAFPSISVSDRLHVIVLPEVVGGNPSLKEEAKRRIYKNASAFLLSILDDEPFEDTLAEARGEAA